MVKSSDYLRLLERWCNAARRHLRPFPGHPEICSYGPGNKGHWAQQTNNTALGAFAELAVNPETDFSRTGMSHDELLDTALSLLRFTLNGHIAGDGTCADGEKWGHSWISNLCVERMMHAVENLEPFMSASEQDSLRRMLFSECDFLVAEYPVDAGLDATKGKNKPESNMWNGSVLWRTALRYPDAPNAAEYRRKGTSLLLNALSMPHDAESNEIFEGRPLKEWHVGANIFETCACNHHNYLNIGYINITLSNLAMLHFSGKHYGWKLPEALYLHAKDIWPFTKTCVFPDGRLLRIGGDSRVRYTYCQDYSIMTWLLMRDILGDTDTEAFEEGWLRQVKREQDANSDGSFLGSRLASLENISPLYYTRLEGDKAASLSMACCWRRRFGEFKDAHATSNTPLLESWQDDFHGSLFTRSKKRVASWTWVASEPPMGLCLPTKRSDLAEWRFNMAGQIKGMGYTIYNHIHPVTKRMFNGGFVTSGHFTTQSYGAAAEGEADDMVAKTQIAYAALPDDATVIVLQRATSLNRFYFRTIKGFCLNVPNGIQNGEMRSLQCESLPPMTLREKPYHGETLVCGQWLNIDGCLAVRSFTGPLIINRPSRPNVCIKSGNALYERSGGQSYTEEICAGQCMDEGHPMQYEQGDLLFDIACAVRIGVTAEETQKWTEEFIPEGMVSCPERFEDLRKAVVRGVDGILYVFIFNVGESALKVNVGSQAVTLQPEEATILRTK